MPTASAYCQTQERVFGLGSRRAEISSCRDAERKLDTKLLLKRDQVDMHITRPLRLPNGTNKKRQKEKNKRKTKEIRETGKPLRIHGGTVRRFRYPKLIILEGPMSKPLREIPNVWIQKQNKNTPLRYCRGVNQRPCNVGAARAVVELFVFGMFPIRLPNPCRPGLRQMLPVEPADRSSRLTV